MPKITFIGAGSTIFLRHILGDALLMPSLQDAEIALMDIDSERLAESELVARQLVDTLSVSTSCLATSSDSARRLSLIHISEPTRPY